MCGIFGQLDRSLDVADREWLTGSATRALAHRGPDGAGHVFDDHCVLGHTRLAILDLTEAASQPFRSACGDLVLVHNGEIYNFLELRQELAPPRGGWRTRSDSEVLVEAFAQRGAGALSSLIGMFAFAVWNARTRELLLARDRVGKKPLYWCRTPRNGIRFGSELHALLGNGVSARTSADRVAEFLQYGYNLAPRTSFLDIHEVPAAHLLRARVTDDGVDVSVERYWDLPAYDPGEAGTFGRWADELRATIGDAVRIRMRSDVPVGAFLSGGVDSSIVAMLASREVGGGLRTVTVDFAEQEFSEAAYAHEVAVHIDTEHTRLRVEPPTFEEVDRLVETFGGLHGDISALPALAACRAAREVVTVALTGDGADELMGGYSRYFLAASSAERARTLPRSVVRAAGIAASRIPPWFGGDGRLALLNDDPARAYLSTVRQFPARSTPPLFREPLVGGADPVAEALARHWHRPPLSRMMAVDLNTYIPGDTNVTLDRASMSVSLELRSPFLDHRLFELVARARPEWIMDGDQGKRPLRYLYGSELPPPVFSRPKRGFGVPMLAWSRGSSFRRLVARAIAPLLADLRAPRPAGSDRDGARLRPSAPPERGPALAPHLPPRLALSLPPGHRLSQDRRGAAWNVARGLRHLPASPHLRVPPLQVVPVPQTLPHLPQRGSSPRPLRRPPRRLYFAPM